ncbi:NAD(P)H-quinone dehydrogenase [Pseudactinotalea sp. HY158]|nr:NAD(P)H-quinone dehydrogenase [Pseudactinotalea sp. HY158]
MAAVTTPLSATAPIPIAPNPPATAPAAAPAPTATRTAERGGRRGFRDHARVAIVGGGPGGYEAALVAAQLGAEVTVVERQGIGGSAVLTDVVPSKALIATAEQATMTESAHELGLEAACGHEGELTVDFARMDSRVLTLAAAQSRDIRTRLEREGVAIVDAHGRLDANGEVVADGRVIEADVVLLSTGARPRVLPTAEPDGERILTWTQVYGLTELPEHLIVVGSGVTGAEFAGAYTGLGAKVTLVSSRDRVLPGEDQDAAEVIEGAFRRRGMTVLSRSRAAAVRRVTSGAGDGVEVELADGRVVAGSHCLVAVGSVPNTEDLGLDEAGVRTTEAGHIDVDRVSRTTARGIYAAGDCTGVHALASVAAMQGRIAMWHALGDAVAPLDLAHASANIFTAPEIATVGISESDITSGRVRGQVAMVPLARNPRAKMQGIREGFIKLFAHRASGLVLGGVVVAPSASELIYPITLAVTNQLTVDQVASAFTVYPSLSGSLAEAARILHDTHA